MKGMLEMTGISRDNWDDWNDLDDWDDCYDWG